MAYFTVYKDTRNEFRWNLRSDNHRVIADSGEGYVRKHDCLAGIQLVKNEAPAANVYDQTQKSLYG